jgi:L-phenylalanine/L-methionine N-acetyltransferase
MMPITIRAAEPSDAALISALVGSPGVVEGTTQLPDAAVAIRTEMYSRIEPGALRLVALDEAGTLIGCAGLGSVGNSLRRAHARYLYISVAAQAQGRGVGHALMSRITHWADQWAGILRIELMVHADNARAIALYERHGFVHEGRMRGYTLCEGRYVDALAMARLHPKPPVIGA